MAVTGPSGYQEITIRKNAAKFAFGYHHPLDQGHIVIGKDRTLWMASGKGSELENIYLVEGQTAIEFSELPPSHNSLYAVLGSQDIQN